MNPASHLQQEPGESLPDPYTDEHHHDHGARFLHDPRRIGRLRFAFLLTLVTMVAEAVGGVISGSLALIADAGHMLVDSAALLFAFLGASFARRPADARRSYGYARLEVLVGYTNAGKSSLLNRLTDAGVLAEDRLFATLNSMTFSRFSSYTLSVIPLFLLMGQFAARGGMSQALFNAAAAFVGHRKGGVAMAAIGVSAGFGSICGSSLATAATMAQVALPELKRLIAQDRYASHRCFWLRGED